MHIGKPLHVSAARPACAGSDLIRSNFEARARPQHFVSLASYVSLEPSCGLNLLSNINIASSIPPPPPSPNTMMVQEIVPYPHHKTPWNMHPLTIPLCAASC